jgi:hypothetical protein
MKKSFLAFAMLGLVLFVSESSAQARLTRDLNIDLWINQAGYLVGATKTVVTSGFTTRQYQVVDIKTMQVVLTDNFRPKSSCDFGSYSTGDFSRLQSPGHYYIQSDTLRSYPFRIADNIYMDAMNLIVGYFSLQRCGASESGYLSPCHLDDGIRIDNGLHQDVAGGWHDASDLRKWVSATIYGMIGLSKAYELTNDVHLKEKIFDELLWGNQYFLKMQEPEGYVMNFVGGDVQVNGDNNRWTDNLITSENRPVKLLQPTMGASTNRMLIMGNADDRVIQTDPVDRLSQYNFIASEAIMSRISVSVDPAYSRRCIDAASKCFEWCRRTPDEVNTGIIGSSIQAALEMYAATGEASYGDYARQQAAELRKLQQRSGGGFLTGFFRSSATSVEPYKSIFHGALEMIAMCDLLRAFPSHPDAAEWRETISRYCLGYLSTMSAKNSFGIVPYGLFAGKDPGGNRRAGEYWYRYFMHPEASWWVGINANIASAGVCLLKASVALNDPSLKSIAQKQLDWIIGVNPFHASTIVGVGYNQPIRFINGGEFRPATPLLPGAVMNGLGGDVSELPHLITENNYNQSEYWTPMVAYTLWLMGELSQPL